MEDLIRIVSPRFGALAVEPGKVIAFPRGLAGFEECRRFTLFHPEGGEPLYYILQSLDDPALAFHVADPARLGFNYEIDLSEEEIASIGLTDLADAAVVVILYKDGPGGATGGLRANLNAPLIVNLRERRGVQHMLAKLNCEVTLKSDA